MLKEKFHIEFVMGSATQASLWRMISQIDGLSEWFADEVTMNEEENVYFEFQLHKLELSNEIALQITDFAEPDEKGDAITLWETQIDKMKRQLGVL